MRIRKLRGRRRKVGGVVLEGDEISQVRDCAVAAIEKEWHGNPSDEPIQNSGSVSIYPSDDDQAYCRIDVGEESIIVPDRTFLLKMLRLL